MTELKRYHQIATIGNILFLLLSLSKCLYIFSWKSLDQCFYDITTASSKIPSLFSLTCWYLDLSGYFWLSFKVNMTHTVPLISPHEVIKTK